MVHQTISTNTANAPRASKINNHMIRLRIAPTGALLGALILGGLLGGCATEPGASRPSAPAAAPTVTPSTTALPAPSPTPLMTPPVSTAGPAGPAASAWLRPRSRWVPVAWAELPGWESDRSVELWPALLRSCERPSSGWQTLCVAAAALPPQNDEQTREWMQRHLQPYRVESIEGASEGLITGYFEPMIAAQRKPDARFKVPLYAPPADLARRKPYWTRQQIDTLPAAQDSLRGNEVAYVDDPLDALILQIQGSGRLQIIEPSGQRQWVRLAFAGHNDQPYKSVGRWLIDQGEITPAQASWPAIKAWAQRNPTRLQSMLWANPRVVFFREEALPNPQLGPKGAQAVPLTPGRSIAVDPQSIPYGTPIWLDTTEPLSNAPLRRIVMAQDTGAAIQGAVRADYFWGWGDEAEQQAGRMKQPLRFWALWPRPARGGKGGEAD
jgi:membrane-bound lytic murein transglycosylase A